jgi:CRISPR-associated protein Cas1
MRITPFYYAQRIADIRKDVDSQVKAQQNKQKSFVLAQRLLDGAGYNMLKNLRYYNNRGKDLEPIIETIEALIGKIASTTAIDEHDGIEGNIRKNYYDAFELIINDFSKDGRSIGHPGTKLMP